MRTHAEAASGRKGSVLMLVLSLTPARVIAIVGLLGIGLGIASLSLEHAPEPISLLSALGGPWLVVAFIAGSRIHRGIFGAVAGVTALVAAWGTYYAGKAVLGSPLNPAEYDKPAFWLAASLVAGAIFGFGGAVYTSSDRWIRVGVVALLFGTCLSDILWRAPTGSTRLMMVGVAVALPLLFLRGWSERLVGVVGTVGAAALIGLLAPLFAEAVSGLR